LLLGTFNVLNFEVARITINPGGFDPFLLLLLIIYYIINRRSVNRILFAFIYGDKKEIGNKHEKMVDFYFEKFKKCDTTELEQINKNFDEYPVEAQIALTKIIDKKEEN
jgi:hypothetical protein